MLLPHATELVPPSPTCGMIENRISARGRRFMGGTVSKIDRNLASAKYYTTMNRRDPAYNPNHLRLTTKALTAPFLKIPDLNVPMGMVVNIPMGHAVRVTAGTQTNLPQIIDTGNQHEPSKPSTNQLPSPLKPVVVSETNPKEPEAKLHAEKPTQNKPIIVPEPRPSGAPEFSSLLPQGAVSDDRKMYRSADMWENLIRRPVPSRPKFGEPIRCPTPPVIVFPPEYTRLRMPMSDHVVKSNLRKDYVIHPDFVSESLHLPYIPGQSSNPFKYGWVG